MPKNRGPPGAPQGSGVSRRATNDGLSKSLEDALAASEARYSALLQRHECLRAELDGRVQQAEALLGLAGQLERAQTYREIMVAAQQSLQAVVGYPRLAAYLVSEDGETATQLEFVSQRDQPEVSERRTFSVTTDPFVQLSISSKDLVVVPDARVHPLTDKAIVAAMGLCTIVNVPIIVMDRHIAIFNTATTVDEGVRVPNESEAEFMMAMSKHIAVAMDRVHQAEERRRAEEAADVLERRLRQAQKLEAIGQLAGGIAHDFNNILTGILGHTEMINLDLRNAAPPRTSSLAAIQSGAERAAELTQQLLTFSRRDLVKPALLDLNAILSETRTLLGRTLGENYQLELSAGPDLGAVRADAGQIEQVVMNLVLNARDAMPDGGRITVETAAVTLDATYRETRPNVEPGRYVMLSISDHGHGMDRETVDRIFDPFFTTKPVGKGTGLGLSTAYGIVDRWGGHFSVYSEPGHGTTIKVFFPETSRRSLPAAEGPPATVSDMLRGSETVLLAEDDKIVRDLAQLILEGAGYTVLSAPTPSAALSLAERHAGKIELLVTDVIMPEMDGRRLAEAVRGIAPNIAVLYMSGYASDVIQHHGALDPEIELLPKPFTRRALLERVRRVLASEA